MSAEVPSGLGVLQRIQEVLEAHDRSPYDRDICECGDGLFTNTEDWAAHVAAAVQSSLVAGRTLISVEELESLPTGALVEHDGKVFRNRGFHYHWQEIAGQRYDHEAAGIVPALLVWSPPPQQSGVVL